MRDEENIYEPEQELDEPILDDEALADDEVEPQDAVEDDDDSEADDEQHLSLWGRCRRWVRSLGYEGEMGDDDEEEDEQTADFKSQFKKYRHLLILLFLGALGMIAVNSYYEHLIVTRTDLENKLKELQNYNTTQSSELARRVRMSVVEDQLKQQGDSTMVVDDDPPFTIEDSEDED